MGGFMSLYFASSSLVKHPFALTSARANMNCTAIYVVMALVDTTPISESARV